MKEQAWVTEYRAHNDALERKLQSNGADERVTLLRRVRVVAGGCADKEAILVALDKMIDAISSRS